MKTTDVMEFLAAIADLDHEKTHGLLTASPSLAVARLARPDECFLAARQTQVYEGDTGLHAERSATTPTSRVN
jgi:hypothetical protein